MKAHRTLSAVLLLAACPAAAQITGPAPGAAVGVTPSTATNAPVAPTLPPYGFSTPGAPFGAQPSTAVVAPIYPFQNTGVPYGQPAAPGQAAPPPSLSTAPPAAVPPAAIPPAVPPAGAPPGSVPRQKQARSDALRGLKSMERSLRELERENEQRAHLLREQFAKRRALLLDSEPWRYASRAERKSQLKALKSEFRQREAWLKQDYRKRLDVLIKDGGAGDLGQNSTY